MKKIDKSNLNFETKKDEENTELIKRWDVENTPFMVVEADEQFFGIMGKYRITEPMKSRKEVEDEITKITWNRIVQIMIIINETNKK